MMTNGDFAMHVMRLAARAASWASDCMILPDYRDKPISEVDAERFIKQQRELLDYIESQTRNVNQQLKEMK